MNNYERYKRLIMFTAALVILFLQTTVYWMVGHQYFNFYIIKQYFQRGNWLMLSIYAVLLLFFSTIYGGYKIGYYKNSDIVYSQILGIIFVNGITYFQICLLNHRFLSVNPILIMSGIDMGIIIFWALIFDGIIKKLYPPHKMILLYAERSADGIIEKMSTRSDRYQICKTMNVNLGMDAIKQVVHDFDAVIIWDISVELRNQILKYCFGQSIQTYVMPKLSDIIITGSDNIDLFDTPLLLSKNHVLTFDQKLLKRLMDIIFSSLALIILSPGMILIGIAIKLYDGGPAFFIQDRCTINSKVFHIFKFRSMIIDAEKDGKSIPTIDQDPRITPIGKILRKARIDELPQLINIILGDMSLVGPRPERIEHVEKYTEEIPEFSYRMKVKGGLTGYAQVIGKYNTTAYDKLKLDLMYIENYSLKLDFKIILMTIKVLFRRESTKGFDAEQKNKLMNHVNISADISSEMAVGLESDK